MQLHVLAWYGVALRLPANAMFLPGAVSNFISQAGHVWTSPLAKVTNEQAHVLLGIFI